MDEDNKTGYGCFVIFIAVVALLVSFVSLLQWDDWTPKVSPASFVVSVLSVLVTLLVGWQIYNAIEVKSILSKFNKLERNFKKSNEALKVQDQRNIALIEAHAQFQTAETSGFSHALKYKTYLEALLLFLDSNISIEHKYINEINDLLDNILNSISNASDDERKSFLHNETSFDELYNKILNCIHHREDDIEKIKSRLMLIHDRRVLECYKIKKE